MMKEESNIKELDVVIFDGWYDWACPKCLHANLLQDWDDKQEEIIDDCKYCGKKVRVRRDK